MITDMAVAAMRPGTDTPIGLFGQAFIPGRTAIMMGTHIMPVPHRIRT